jgi:hypothetical protein
MRGYAGPGIVGPSDARMHAMRGKMGPQPSTPGVPLHQTAAMHAPMAEHESQGMSGFDYAMVGRMQRMDAGLAPIERSMPTPPEPLRKGYQDIDFEFLLNMSDDFLWKAEEMLTLLEE